ncbi:MAG TPA: tetratricopeptide repeat protein, partial [Herpetosiphonaceae bacterium]
YLEELLHYVNENKIDSAGELAGEALPPSLHSLVLSRVDLLNDQQKLTVKLASVIGRVFPAPWLWGYYPALGAPAQVMRDLALLSRLDITPLERTEPDRTYLFKHAITHEVVYESMGFEQRRELHGQLGDFIEAGAGSEQQLDALAFHYRRSNQPAKRRRYGRLAGDHARQAGGYGAAREHYLDALALVEAPRDAAELLFDLAGIAELTGRWQEALDRYDEILRHGDALPADWTPRAGHGRAKVLSRQSAYQEALAWLDQAEAGFRALGDAASQAEVLADRASILWRQGELDLGEACLEQALALSSDHPPALARIYNTLGNLAYSRGDLAQAVAHHEQSLRLRQALGDRRGTAGSLTNLGMAAANRGDFERALGLLERSLALTQEIGDAQGCAHGLMNVATMDYKRGELDRARAGYRESIALARELGDRMALVYGLVGAAAVAAAAREAALAIQLMAAAQRGLGELGAVLEPFEQAMADEALAAARELLPAAEIAALQGAALPLDDAASLALGEIA